MRKLTTLTAAAVLAVAMGFGGAAWADEFADAVDSFAYPAGDDCPTAGGFCDTSGDDDDQGLDARFADNGAAGDNTTFTSLGFNSDTGLGGVLVLNFDSNLCFDDPLGKDMTVYEIDGTHGGGGTAESYDVSVGLQGATLTGAGNHNGTQDIESPVAFFNQIEIEATNDAGGTTAGADIDAVECASTLDVVDITKDFAENPRDLDDPMEINVRVKGEDDPEDQQFKAFTITIANNTGVVGTGASSAFNGLTFFDAVPAEYDLDSEGEDAATGGDTVTAAAEDAATGTANEEDESDDGQVNNSCDSTTFDPGGTADTACDGLNFCADLNCDGNFVDGICDDNDASCNGIAEDPNGKCAVTADIPNGAKAGHGNGKLRSKLEPELLSINANGLSDGEECTTTVYVMTDLGDHKKMFTPTSCPVDLNSGVKVFDSTMNLLLQDDSFLIFDQGAPRLEDEGGNDGICNDVVDD